MSGLGSCIGLFGQFPCLPLPNPYKEVTQGSVGLISRFGQFYKSVDPGLVQVNVCSESISVVGESSRLDMSLTSRCQDPTHPGPHSNCPNQGQRLCQRRFCYFLARSLALPRRLWYQQPRRSSRRTRPNHSPSSRRWPCPPVRHLRP